MKVLVSLVLLLVACGPTAVDDNGGSTGFGGGVAVDATVEAIVEAAEARVGVLTS